MAPTKQPMKRYRYIIDTNARRTSSLRSVRLYANNQLPSDVNVCFRVCARRDTDTARMGGYSTTHDPRRLEELNIVLRVRRAGDWETRPMMPGDNRTLGEITSDIDEEMCGRGYVLDTEDGEGYVMCESVVEDADEKDADEEKGDESDD